MEDSALFGASDFLGLNFHGHFFATSVEKNNKLLTSLSKQRKFFGCLRRNNYVTVLFKQTSDKVPGEFLGRLVLGVEDDKVKIFGATIF